MAGNRIETMPINSDSLKEQFRARRLSNAQASIGLGYSQQYFTNTMARGTIAKPAVVMLEKIYNIDPKEYIVSDKVDNDPDTTDLDELYKVVYDAVYKAMKMAIKETMYDIAKAAVRDGMREA